MSSYSSFNLALLEPHQLFLHLFMALLHLLHSQQELLKPFNAVSALKLLRSILRVVLFLLFQRQCLFDLCLKEVPVKAEEREPHYNGEGHDASDVGEV